MASFLTPFMGAAVNVALPALGREFSMNALSLNWVATSFLLAAAMSLVPLGRIADLYGRKRIFLWGIVLFTLSSLGCSLAPDAALLHISLFQRNRAFTFSSLAALIHYCATYAVSFLMALYLQFIMGFSPQYAGTILLIQPVIQAAFSPLIGRLSDGIEPRILASLGMSLTVCGLFLLVFLSPQTSLSYIVSSFVLLGLGFTLFSSPNVNAIMSSVDRKFLGLASGTLATMRILGQMFSMGIAMLIFALFIGKAQISPPTYPLFLKSMKMTLSLLAILCFLGIFASLARGRMR